MREDDYISITDYDNAYQSEEDQLNEYINYFHGGDDPHFDLGEE